MKKSTKKVVFLVLYLIFVAACSIGVYLVIAESEPKKQEKQAIPVITRD